MSKILISAAEVVEIALHKDFLPAKIKETKILIAQENYIRPVLTLGLYNRVIAEVTLAEGGGLPISLNVEYILTQFIKPALAYFVVYEIIPETFLQITNKGGQKPVTEHSQGTSKDERDTLRANVLASGNSFMNMLTRDIETDPLGREKYPEYEKFSNVKNQIRIRGGIIFGKKKCRD